MTVPCVAASRRVGLARRIPPRAPTAAALLTPARDAGVVARRLADMLRPTLNPVAGRRAGAGAAREMEPGRFLVLAGGKVSPSRGSICGQRLSCRTVAQALQHARPRVP